ncbi:YecA family protein [Ottowia thiooxydans]|uniref:YecA/YgfB family protein n=1 Tax=Ottowia thiooxydans TaxID=219182 RepID=UPI000490A00D|nr:UPF0149 family protein [Ottowia thiooxydans]
MTSLSAPDSDGNSPEDDATLVIIEALDEVLGELSEHHESIPMWEFCDGAITALLCTRRQIPENEYLSVILSLNADELNAATGFASEAQRTRFQMNWLAREAQIRASLDAPVEALDDPRALDPVVMDMRGMVAAQPLEDASPEEENEEPLAAFAYPWAQGFMAVVETWDQEWEPPRDKAIASDMADALDCIRALCSDDTAEPALNLFEEEGPPSVSEERMEQFGEALWAVYDLYAIAKSLGPRVDPIRNDAKVGRNDPCSCGSGKKFKKCCGA